MKLFTESTKYSLVGFVFTLLMITVQVINRVFNKICTFDKTTLCLIEAHTINVYISLDFISL